MYENAFEITCNSNRVSEGISSDFWVNEPEQGGIGFHKFEVEDNLHFARVGKAPSPVGRLRDNFEAWKKLGITPFLMGVIKEGYKLPLVTMPDPIELSNNKSASKNADFVYEALQKLEILGCISEVSHKLYVTNPLSVSEREDGKKRLVLDLRHVNPHLVKQKFRCEDVSIVEQIIEEDDYMFSFDIRHAFHHIEIYREHRKFLGFEWGGKYYVFCVLAFGLGSAPFLFTKLLRPVVGKWRSEGKKVVVFYDDGIAGAKTHGLAKTASIEIKRDLENLGFILSDEKCDWEPKQKQGWLGFVIDSHLCSVSVSQPRVKKLKLSIGNLITRITGGGVVTARQVAAVVGQVCSMFRGIGNIVYIRTRELQKAAMLGSLLSWDRPTLISQQGVQELKFWLENIDNKNGRNFTQIGPCEIVGFSDASETGLGGFIDSEGSVKIVQENWEETEANQSSTWRELQAIYKCVLALRAHTANRVVKWHTDNANVCYILQKGSMKDNLQEIVLKIYYYCEIHNITLTVTWLPRADNKVADALSRVVDRDDWEIKLDVFERLDQAWGPYTVDRFANAYNNKCDKFNSRYYSEGCEGVDAFSVTWEGENNWIVPPPTQVTRVLRHVITCNAMGCLVIPVWRSAPYWTVLCPGGSHLHPVVQDWLFLQPNCVQRGKYRETIFGRQDYVSMFDVGYWNEMKRICTGVENQTLYNIAKNLAASSRAGSTTKQYVNSTNKWSDYARARQWSIFPASPVHVAIYLTDLFTEKSSFSVIQQSFYAFSWSHTVAGVTNPVDNSFVRSIVEGAKRQLAKPVVHKEPVEPEHLKALCDKEDISNLTVVRDLTMALVMFAGFLRYNEVSELQTSDVQFFESHMVLQIRMSKTDQYREGRTLVISRLSSNSCPVRMMEKYFAMAGLSTQNNVYIFRPLTSSKGKVKLVSTNKKLSYSRTRETVVARLKKVTGGGNYGLNSFRSGGVTKAANEGVGDRNLKRHGRWKTDQAKDRYIKDSLEARLDITKNLGL